jgi:hypothetical protein
VVKTHDQNLGASKLFDLLPHLHRISAVLRRFGFAIFFLKGDENDTVNGQHIIIIVTLLFLSQASPCRSFSPLRRCRASYCLLPLSWTRRNESWRNASVGGGHGAAAAR